MLQLLWVVAIAGVASPFVEQIPPLPGVREEIVVTATLAEESRRRVPASMTVIEGAEIRRRQATEVHQLLRTVPGLSVAQSGSPGKVTSLFTRGAASNQTLVLWNGLRLNDPYFGGFDWASLPTDGVDRLEVVRGPASALYGSNAIGGVVQVLSGPRDGGSLRVEAGEASYGRLGATWGGTFGAADVTVAAHARRGNGAAENDFFDGEELMLRTAWAIGDDMSLGVLARAGESEIGIPVASGAAAPERRQETRTSQIAVPFALQRGRWKVEASLGQVRSDLRFSDPQAVFSDSRTDAERRRLRGLATYRAAERWWVAVGGEWGQEEVTDESNFGISLDGGSRSTYAVFGEMRKDWSRVHLDLGLRRDDDEFYGSATSPRLGLVVDLPAESQLYASYGEGFRAPSLGELFFPFYGNPDLRPEESRTWEVGARHSGERWSANVSIFSTDLDNLIETDPLSFTAVNVGRAKLDGVEIEVGYRRGVVAARAWMTLLDTEDLATGRDLLRRPGESAAVLLTWMPGDFITTLTGRWVGERNDIDPVTFERRRNEEHLVADLAVTWQTSKRLAPFARVENLGDTAFEEVLGFPALGRTFIGGLEVGLP